MPAEPVAAPAPRRFTGFSSTFRAVDQIVNTPGMLPFYDASYDPSYEEEPAAAATDPAAAAAVADPAAAAAAAPAEAAAAAV
jgi:hypothetical protein